MKTLLMKKIPSVVSLNLSNIMENGLLKKYDTILSYNDFEHNYKNLTIEDEKRFFELFCDILMGEDSRYILLMDRKESNENSWGGRTIYTTDDEHTQKTMKSMLELLYYFQYGFSELKPVFENIKTHQNFKTLLENEYDFFDKKDQSELMSYFWKYEFNFKFKG